MYKSFSLITISKNNALTIAQTIDSVNSQSHQPDEWVIKDGGSTDETLSILKSYSNHNMKLYTETDNGLYEALNQAIMHATGDYIGILHADDLFASPDTLAHISKALEKYAPPVLYGDLVYFAEQNNKKKIVRRWKSGAYDIQKFKYGWMPPHPTLVVHRSVFEKWGLYRTDMRTAADYEFMLRVLYKYKTEAYYLPEITSYMRMGGISNKSLANRLNANKEDRRAWQINGLNMPFYLPLFKPLRKLGQFLR